MQSDLLIIFILQIREAICELIATQGFREILWAALDRPIADFAQGQARLADLYPEVIQTLAGDLGKGIVGVLVALVSLFSSILSVNINDLLKTMELYPQIMAALDVMYANPCHFDSFLMWPGSSLTYGKYRDLFLVLLIATYI